MHVYLKNGEQKRWLIVELVDGHVPKLTGISGNQSQLVTDTLEPAIWFKIIVIDSVSIDCQKHVVSWNINSAHAGSGENGKKDKTKVASRCLASRPHQLLFQNCGTSEGWVFFL